MKANRTAHLNGTPGGNEDPGPVGEHNQAVGPPIQCEDSRWERFRRVLRQMASIEPRHLHGHNGQRRYEQHDTDPS